MTSKHFTERRVVITGIGGITPIGNDVETFWQSCVEGRSGVDGISHMNADNYLVKVDAEVRGFEPRDFIEHKEARRMARFSQFAVASAYMALKQSELKLEDEDPERIGVLCGTGIYPDTDEAVRTIVEKGGNRLDPFYMPKMLPNMAAAHVAMQLQLKGYNNTVSTACAAGTQAIGDALNIIRLGRADIMFAGGAEAGITELGSSAAKAPAFSSSKPSSMPRSEALTSFASLPATAQRQTPTISSPPVWTAKAPSGP
jgi:3-oxoacyl-(acyl-carrier-protein) synthase